MATTTSDDVLDSKLVTDEQLEPLALELGIPEEKIPRNKPSLRSLISGVLLARMLAPAPAPAPRASSSSSTATVDTTALLQQQVAQQQLLLSALATQLADAHTSAQEQSAALLAFLKAPQAQPLQPQPPQDQAALSLAQTLQTLLSNEHVAPSHVAPSNKFPPRADVAFSGSTDVDVQAWVDSLRHLKVVFPGLADKKGAAALIVSALSGNALAWYQTLTADRKATLEEDGDALAKAIQDYFGPPQALASSARLETLHLPLGGDEVAFIAGFRRDVQRAKPGPLVALQALKRGISHLPDFVCLAVAESVQLEAVDSEESLDKALAVLQAKISTLRGSAKWSAPGKIAAVASPPASSSSSRPFRNPWPDTSKPPKTECPACAAAGSPGQMHWRKFCPGPANKPGDSVNKSEKKTNFALGNCTNETTTVASKDSVSSSSSSSSPTSSAPAPVPHSVNSAHPASGGVPFTHSVIVVGHSVQALFDTGAGRSCISEDVVHRLGLPRHRLDVHLVGADRQPLAVAGCSTTVLKIGSVSFEWPFVIVRNLNFDVILGTDALPALGANFDCAHGTLTIKSTDRVGNIIATETLLFPKNMVNAFSGQPAPAHAAQSPPASLTPSPAAPSSDATCVPRRAPLKFNYLMLARDFTVPARSETYVPVRTVLPVDLLDQSDPVYTVPVVDTRHKGVRFEATHGVVNPAQLHNGQSIPYRVVNASLSSITIPKGYRLLCTDRLLSEDELLALSPAVIAALSTPSAGPTSESSMPDPSEAHPSTWTNEERETAIAAAVPDDHPHRDELRPFLRRVYGAFGTSPTKVPTADVPGHTIPTSADRPVRSHPRRMNPARADVLQAQVDQLLADDIIEHSSSPWSSEAVLIRKTDGKWRFCVDYRALNAVTIGDVYALPRIDDILDRLGGKLYFSTLDLQSGYWQIPMSPADAVKTDFHGPRGLYQFKRMPFGLKNAPASFQRAMDLVLAGLVGVSCWVYLDDIIIASSSFEQHLVDLEAVLTRLQSAGFTVKLSKCTFAQPSLHFLGHVISKDGVRADPRKTQALHDMPAPKNVFELRSFLGGAGYFRRFIKGYGQIASPLTRLLKADVPFIWSEECRLAFDTIKQALVAPPILAYPNWSKEFILYTDASKAGLGIALSQLDDNGHEHVVLYDSRTLTAEEKGYGVSDMEGAAVIWALKKHRVYLLGQHFTLVTDHSALKATLKTSKEDTLSSRQLRWAALAQEYDFSIVYRKGSLHGNVDMLSRLPQPDQPTAETIAAVTRGQNRASAPTPAPAAPPPVMATPPTPAPSTSTTLAIPTTVTPAPPASPPAVFNSAFLWPADSTVLATAQLEDPWCAQFIRYLTSQTVPRTSADAAALAAAASDFHMHDGLLYHGIDSSDRTAALLAVPLRLRAEFLQCLHDDPTAGHQGTERTLAWARSRFFWPSLRDDVTTYCRSCTSCQQRNNRTVAQSGQLEPITSSTPSEISGMDILTSLPVTTSGNRHIFVKTDYFTKYVELFALSDLEARSIAAKLQKSALLFGPPKRIISDLGSQFTSHVVSAFRALYGIKHTPTTAYHQQANGLTERFNATMCKMLTHYVNDKQSDWDLHLDAVASAYNASVHSSTGVSPFKLLFGRDPVLPVDRVLPAPVPGPKSVRLYQQQLHATLKSAHALAAKHLTKAQETQKTYYDAHHRDVTYDIGDTVSLFNPATPVGLSSKLIGHWSLPHTVIARNGQNYDIKDEGDNVQQVHVQRLRPAFQRPPDLHPPGSIPPASQEDEEEPLDDDEFKVDKIIDRRLNGNAYEYLVRWSGYGSDDDTWERDAQFSPFVRKLARALDRKLDNARDVRQP